jgi:sulfhydrogenase subunit gamma (sulfur reductase)
MSSTHLENRSHEKGEEIYLPRMAKVIRAEKISEKEKLFELKFNDGKDLGHKPGQFVEVSVFGIGECPISVSSSPTKKGSFELVIRLAGNVTKALHDVKTGDMVGIRGPYGRGFDTEFLKGKDVLFIGGGIGIVPLRSLINYVIDKRSDYNAVSILYGCREPKELLFPQERKIWEGSKNLLYKVTVDKAQPSDNWKGNVGVITTLIPPLDINTSSTYAVVCGPPVMYKFVVRSLKEKGLADDHIILSLERRMKCGVGKCGHCQIGPYYACREGPVFSYAEIRDVKEAL